eukprot:Gregarina_sp_Poly_1__8903@NODE_538_length_7624_cov_89_908694_g425_i0_p7_GENE_NODE_538_length_7624_cov_89_908694_g425_i0NODE_538_length_7624_cov_89_908694_g425_i0_p7_ORF_typecomplete_len145_score18_62GAPT/PF11770_8/0_0077Cadherin_C_2/PF16492_5/0_022DUF4834/PF16118_5/0_048Shisa/PF13908_6/0_065_NODE_538_length_7624_cov_89_908694_g425_i056736107
MSTASPFAKKLGELLAGVRHSRFFKPFIFFSNKCLYEPMQKIIFYNEATEKFASEHPTLVALSILFVIYVLVLLMAHCCHVLFLKIHGPSRWHLASRDLEQSARERQAAPKRRASAKRKASVESQDSKEIPKGTASRRKSKKDQ